MTIVENVHRIKEGVRNAFTSITNKGVTVPAGSRAEDLAELIDVISTGTDVSDTTATADKVLEGSEFYGADGVKTEGTMIDNSDWDDVTLLPSESIVIPMGYHSGTGSVIARANNAFVNLTTRGSAIDLGESNIIRWVGTNSVPNRNTTTYRYDSDSPYFVDLGVDNEVRYVDASSVAGISNPELVYNDTTNTDYQFTLEPNVGYLFTVYAYYNSSTGSSSASISFSDTPDISLPLELCNTTRAKVYIAIARTTRDDIVVTLSATRSTGAANASGKSIYKLS